MNKRTCIGRIFGVIGSAIALVAGLLLPGGLLGAAGEGGVTGGVATSSGSTKGKFAFSDIVSQSRADSGPVQYVVTALPANYQAYEFFGNNAVLLHNWLNDPAWIRCQNDQAVPISDYPYYSLFDDNENRLFYDSDNGVMLEKYGEPAVPLNLAAGQGSSPGLNYLSGDYGIGNFIVSENPLLYANARWHIPTNTVEEIGTAFSTYPATVQPIRVNERGDYAAWKYGPPNETGARAIEGSYITINSTGQSHYLPGFQIWELNNKGEATLIEINATDTGDPYFWDGALHPLGSAGGTPWSLNDLGQIVVVEYEGWDVRRTVLWEKKLTPDGETSLVPTDLSEMTGLAHIVLALVNNQGSILIETRPLGLPEYPQCYLLVRKSDCLGVDADRDGVINPSLADDNPDRLHDRKGLPWFFWVNDDNDANETDGNDIPGGGSNALNNTVDSVRDLVDFFPVHLNIAGLLTQYPITDTSVAYKLAQADGAANFLITDLGPGEAGKYHSESDVAQSLGDKPVTLITATGVELDRNFLAKIATEGKGVILVEARKETGEPLRLEVWQGGVLQEKIELPLRFVEVETMFRHKNLVAAAGMTPETADRAGAPNGPDEMTNNQAFVFVHGYNVNQERARGWHAETFKRLWWSGSNAQFWGMTWYGTESQKKIGSGYLTSNYQANVIHAFGTAYKLKAFIAELKQAGGEGFKVNVAGHSLGNMVVSSALSDHDAPADRYFMLDAAVAAEAYDGEGGDNNLERVVQPDDATANMPHSEWNREFGKVYPPKLWATNWHQLFKPPMNDARYRLTWRDRFPLRPGTDYFDFYSTGEEVLDYDGAYTPSLGFVLLQTAANKLGEVMQFQVPFIGTGQPAGHKSWQYQEQLKGRTITGKVLGSNFGGWGFNSFHFRKSPGGAGGRGPVLTPAVLRPDDLTPEMLSQVFTDEVLREDPFFRPGGRWRKVGSWQRDSHAFLKENLGLLYDPATGSAFASRHRDALLARMIPAMSPPAGRIAVPKLTPPNTPSRNFDMNGTDIRPINPGEVSPPWPAGRGQDFRWRHSDLREVAYPFVRGLYKQITSAGSLGDPAP